MAIDPGLARILKELNTRLARQNELLEELNCYQRRQAMIENARLRALEVGRHIPLAFPGAGIAGGGGVATTAPYVNTTGTEVLIRVDCWAIGPSGLALPFDIVFTLGPSPGAGQGQGQWIQTKNNPQDYICEPGAQITFFGTNPDGAAPIVFCGVDIYEISLGDVAFSAGRVALPDASALLRSRRITPLRSGRGI